MVKSAKGEATQAPLDHRLYSQIRIGLVQRQPNLTNLARRFGYERMEERGWQSQSRLENGDGLWPGFSNDEQFVVNWPYSNWPCPKEYLNSQTKGRMPNKREK
jgi:hypothetical protein